MIPNFIQPFLWSYDLSSLDLNKDKKRIITNVLNLGTKKATDWLFETYTKDQISECLTNPLTGEWNAKSLSYWSLILNIKPGQTSTRIIS